jgi:hypothetical protein
MQIFNMVEGRDYGHALEIKAATFYNIHKC